MVNARFKIIYTGPINASNKEVQNGHEKWRMLSKFTSFCCPSRMNKIKPIKEKQIDALNKLK